MPLVQKVRKLPNSFHGIICNQGINSSKILVVVKFDPIQNAAKEWDWRSNLWAIDLGIYSSNVYRKISAAPLTLLHSERPKLHTVMAFLRANGLNILGSAYHSI